MNEALSGEATQIIADEPSSTSSSEMSSVLEQPPGTTSARSTSELGEEFVPYLLVHSIVSANNGSNKSKNEWKRDKIGSGSPKNVNLVSTVQDLMMPQIMEVDEEPDVQIIGYSPPGAMNNNTMAPPANEMLSKLVSHVVATGGVAPPEMFGLPDLVENKSGQVTVDVDKPGEVVVLNSEKGEDVKDGTGSDFSPVLEKEGHAAQCIALPAEVTPDQYVVSITPNHHSSHVIVVTAPKTLHRRISVLCGVTAYCHSSDNASSSGASNDTVCNKSSEQNNANVQNNEKHVASTGGCILIYKANVENGRMVLLHDKPVVTRTLDSVDDAVMSVLLLPRDIAQGQGEELDSHRPDLFASLNPSAAAAGSCVDMSASADVSNGGDLLDGYIAITTYSGTVHVIRIDDCKVLLTIQPPEGDKFISLTYCTGEV